MTIDNHDFHLHFVPGVENERLQCNVSTNRNRRYQLKDDDDDMYAATDKISYRVQSPLRNAVLVASSTTTTPVRFVPSNLLRSSPGPQPPIPPVGQEALSIMSGVVAFGSTLALSTFVQGKLLHVSTGTVGPIPSVLGFTTVCVASLISHHVATSVHQYSDATFRRQRTRRWPTGSTAILDDIEQYATTITSSMKQMSADTYTSIQQFKKDISKLSVDADSCKKMLRQGSIWCRDNVQQRWRRYKNKDMIDFQGYFQVPIHTIGL
jgi:hypothetical protein